MGKSQMCYPFYCYLGVSITFTATYAIFRYTSLDPQRFFYIPIFLLIACYTVVSMLSDKQVYQARRFKQVIFKSICKYIYWGLVIAGVIWFYNAHPAYKAVTPNTQIFLKHFFCIFAVCGLPYLFLEEKFRYCRENVLADPYLKIVVLIRCLLKLNFSRFKRRLLSKKSRGMFFAAVLRIHYLPIMVEQVHFGITFLTRDAAFGNTTQYSAILMLATLTWLIDSNNASIGYFWQSAFTKTRFRAIDLNPGHWIVVLACYTPFIYFVTSYLAAFPSLPETSQRIFSSAGVNTAIDITMLIALILYMFSSCALGFSYSNLCYKKIQTKGPYRLMRHPATTFKLIYFALAFYRFAPAYTAGWLVFFLFWIAIYIGRALVEEQFLVRFPEYRAYMKQTRYRFIPRIV
ncbi:MAG: methyltransferase family protein [Planctomycetota bacterium]|jgi:protein-S-isoprenylcysteine O-methyltransferase Ste14